MAEARFDRRLTPARPDLAAAGLEGKVEATSYAPGHVTTLIAGVANLWRAPSPDAPMDTQLLFGERFTVYDEKSGWAWGQSNLDGYVGYVEVSALGHVPHRDTHRVANICSHIYPGADFKHAPMTALPMNARLAVGPHDGRFAQVLSGGFVPEMHLAPVETIAPDFVAIAERFLGTPYLWGGRTSSGIDCSGLVQVALHAAGIPALRDSDMQEQQLGYALPQSAWRDLRRGDLVFWHDHVGIMIDPVTLLHANAHDMAVEREPLAAVAARNDAKGKPVTNIRRLPLPTEEGGRGA